MSKRSPVVHGAGNINLKGKRSRLLRCGCCVAIDFRDDVLKKEHSKEVREYKNG